MSGNSIKKEKRPRSNSNEANNSFVKNVTSKVTGMLPAKIAKWFSSPSSSNDAPKSNGSTVTGDATDSSTEDEAPDSPVTIQPPAKRMRLSPPAKFQHFSPDESTVSNIEALEPITPYNNTQSTHRIEYNSRFLDLQIPKSDASQDRVERNSSNAFKAQHSISSAPLGAGSRKRKSIFDTPSTSDLKNKTIEKAATNTSRDPSFKPCLLGSPFYAGRTMYGGAAASYLNQAYVKQQKPTVVNEHINGNNNISRSALRVMELLEQFSSPLSEARRIPIISPSRCRENLLSRLESLTRPQSSRSLSYKTQELHVPSIASVLRMKQRSRLVNTTNAARQILASHSSTSDQPFVSISNRNRTSNKESSATSHNYTSKIKSRLTSTRRGNVNEDITAEPVNLPSATLKIDQSQLQNFSFGISMASSPITTKPMTVTVQTNPKITENTPKANESTPYQFSSPAKVAPSPNVVNIKSPGIDHRPKFTFVSPERSVVQKSDEQKQNRDVIDEETHTMKSEVTSSQCKDWKCGDCWVSNKADVEKCVCCGGKKPSKTESNMKCPACKVADKQQNSEKCVNCDKTLVVNNSCPIIKENNNSKWKCDDCWVSNDATAEKCLCCGAAKPKKASPAAASNAVPSALDEDWKCDDCWIKNKNSADRCAACGGSKPRTKQAASPIFNSTIAPIASDSKVKGLLKSQSEKWECPSCLVRNDKDKLKCVCCDSEKPGTNKESEKSKFNFDQKANVTFKFGIDPKLQQNNLSKAVENKISEVPKEAESEKNNNVLPKTPSFTFGLPTKKVDDQPKQDQIKTVPAVTFTFGVPKSLNADSTSTSIPAHTFTFANNVTKPESDKLVDTERPQEVPKIDFSSPITSPKNQDIQKTSMLFSMPVKTSQLKGKTAQTLSFGAPLTGDKKDSPASTSISAAESKPTTTFTFSGSPAKAAAVPEPASEPLFATTATPSLFGDDKLTTPVTSTTAAPPPAANASMFSFGNPAAEKPKFNFTFSGQSKTETPAPMFGNAKPDGPAPMFGNNKTDLPAPLFGNAKTDAPSLFGSTKTDAPPAVLFGANTKDSSAPLFGNTKTETPVNMFANIKPDPKLFRSPNKTDAPLFGAGTKADSPLFGSSTKTNAPLFGNTSNSETPLFGSTTKTDAPLFGNTPKPEPALFGSGNKIESSMFKFGGSAEANAGGNKFGSNMFGATSNDAPSFGSPQPATGMFASQKPASFSFGSTPVFGATSPSFGASEPAPMFGATTSTPANNMFGASAGSVPGTGMFGSPNPVGASNFGTPNATVPPYEASSLTPASTPAFNFGASQNTGVFGFGQQPQTAQAVGGAAPGGGGVYTFGGAAGAPGPAGLQFSMGAGAAAPGPGAAGGPPRRVRKVARRNLPR